MGVHSLVVLAAVDGQIRGVRPLVAAVLQRPAVARLARAVRLVAEPPVPLVAHLYVREVPGLAARLGPV